MIKSFIIGLFIIFSMNTFSQSLVEKDGKHYVNDKLYSGVYKDKNEKSIIVSERNFRDGFEHGVSTYYFDNANIHEQRSYNMGFKDGTWITWEKDGTKTAEANYSNDLKHGRWYIFDEKGNKRYEMFYHKGEKVGSWYMWDEDGKLISEKKF